MKVTLKNIHDGIVMSQDILKPPRVHIPLLQGPGGWLVARMPWLMD